MLISVLEFGSIWTRRLRPTNSRNDVFGPRQLAYYNTTGVLAAGKMRNRPRHYGFARFNGVSGCRPDCEQQMRGKVFQCDPPCTWDGAMKVLFKARLGRPARPDAYLTVLKSGEFGTLGASVAWHSPEATLISFSECGSLQEAMIIVPAFGWVRSGRGSLFLEPVANQPWRASWVVSGV